MTFLQLCFHCCTLFMLLASTRAPAAGSAVLSPLRLRACCSSHAAVQMCMLFLYACTCRMHACCETGSNKHFTWLVCAGEGSLQPEQRAKIAGEAALVSEIEALGGTA